MPVLPAAAATKKDAATTPPTSKEKEEERKSRTEPNAEEEPILGPLPILEMQPTPKQEPLPLCFALPLPAPIPDEVQAAPAPQASPELEVQALRPAIPNLPASVRAVPMKAKASALAEPELLSALQLPVKDAPKDKPLGEIAFEAKLTQAQTTPARPTQATPQATTPPVPQPPAPTSPPVPNSEAKAPEKPASATEMAAPAPASRQAVLPHNAEPAVKVLEAAVSPVPVPTTERSVSSAPRTEVAAPPAAPASDIPDLAAPRTEPARDISFRIASAQNDAVDVKLVDRAGQIHVAVRSADPVLTQSLQANVTDLASKLDKAGFQTETMIPNRSEPVQQPQQNQSFQNFQQDRRAPQQELPSRKKRTAAPTSTFTLNPIQENA